MPQPEQKEWKKDSLRSQVERFKTNPQLELLLEKQNADPQFISTLSPQQRLSLHRYAQLRKKTGRR